jgi:hypothetical protein
VCADGMTLSKLTTEQMEKKILYAEDICAEAYRLQSSTAAFISLSGVMAAHHSPILWTPSLK